MSYSKHSPFCPITLACQILQPRWTIQILAEIGWGSHCFNEIKQHIPGLSPSLLSKRLKDMENNLLIYRKKSSCGRVTYHRTACGKALEPVIKQLGLWAQQQLEAGNFGEQAELMSLLMHLRHSLDQSNMPEREVLIELHLFDKPESTSHFWLHSIPQKPIELHTISPTVETDLYISCTYPNLLNFYYGRLSLPSMIDDRLINIFGNQELKASVSRWLLCRPSVHQHDIAKYRHIA